MLFDYLGVLRGEEKYKKIIFFAFFLKNSLSVQKKSSTFAPHFRRMMLMMIGLKSELPL